MQPDIGWFQNARYGLFMHYGLYSLLGRGEWVMNREQIPVAEYKKLAQRFTAEKFNADDIIRRAKNDWGMKYAVLTTKHHEGFCLYDSKMTDFTSVKTAAKRDLVAEFVNACRKHGFRVGLYHSLNDWSTSPNAVDALERPAECCQKFIDFVHGQIREIMTNYGKIDVMWYDGWWPFDGGEKGWQAEKLNAMVRGLQPGIIVNGRCGLPGDFTTPEGHVTSAKTMWEACMTLNNSWGWHGGDNNWKSPQTVCEMLRKAASGRGNLLLNVGPKPDGSIPQPSIDILNKVGDWLKANGESIYDSDRFEVEAHTRTERADWTHHGLYTARGNNFYLHLHSWPGRELVITGVECKVTAVEFLATREKIRFVQATSDNPALGSLARDNWPGLTDLGRGICSKLICDLGRDDYDISMPVVIHFSTADEPRIYRSGGHRDPMCNHCRYDPCPSETAG
jgi:alpha-L-fucosidase